MNPFFQQLLIQATIRSKKKGTPPNRYRQARDYFRMRIALKHFAKDIFLICIGVFVAGFGLKGFLLPASLIDGGVTGISLLTAEVTGFGLPLLLVCYNIPFIALGWKQISKGFAIRSIITITALALVIGFVHFPVITSDKLLVAVFGGLLIGAGIGFAMRGGAVLDGTEILAIYLGKRTNMKVGDVILLLNIVIFSVAAYIMNIEMALYSILCYLAASKTVDFIIEGIEEYTGVTIVSSHSEEIRIMITEKLGRGVTIYNGKRGFGKRGDNLDHTDIVYTVITRLEISNLQAELDKIDPNAFVVMTAVKDTRGGMIKKRILHEKMTKTAQ